MQFQVPQFIERESKIIGPLTFKQFIFIGAAGGICFVLYFLVPLQLFILAAIILGGGSVVLAFVKIKGISLPVFLGNFLKYSVSPKLYIWKKKEFPPKLIMRKKTPEKKEEEILPGLAEKSQLKKLSIKIETRKTL